MYLRRGFHRALSTDMRQENKVLRRAPNWALLSLKIADRYLLLDLGNVCVAFSLQAEDLLYNSWLRLHYSYLFPIRRCMNVVKPRIILTLPRS